MGWAGSSAYPLHRGVVAVLNPRRETAVYARVLLDSSSASELTIGYRDGADASTS
jgi:hypothetical protein